MDAPIACTLTGVGFQQRLDAIAALLAEGLRSYTRRDLVLDLEFDPAVADRVRDLKRLEEACCGFLDFALTESADAIRLTITAPERARATADDLFDQFLARDPRRSGADGA